MRMMENLWRMKGMYEDYMDDRHDRRKDSYKRHRSQAWMWSLVSMIFFFTGISFVMAQYHRSRMRRLK